MEEEVTINGRRFTILQEPTKNKHARAFIDGSAIRIGIPVSWPREEGFRAFLDLKRRVLQKLRDNPSYLAERKQLSFADGQEVNLMGRRFLLRKSIGRGEKTSSATLSGDNAIVRLSPSLPSDESEKVFSNLSRRVIASALHSKVEARVRMLNDTHFQGRLSKVFIKDNLSNYGSCSSSNNINLSFRALFAPSEVLDYIIIHELAHLTERNHSPAFWALVERAMPSYKIQRKWLKANSHGLGAADRAGIAVIDRVA